jgi:hypothetical protein
MSAFVVSDNHIDALVTFARNQEGLLGRMLRRANVTTYDATETSIGRILLAENVRSVCHRYPDDEPESIEHYKFAPFPLPLEPRQIAVFVLKAAHCLDYQSCETDDWPETVACALLQMIERRACSILCDTLPEYDAAPWGVQVRE